MDLVHAAQGRAEQQGPARGKDAARAGRDQDEIAVQISRDRRLV
jgi:hypothetical protein